MAQYDPRVDIFIEKSQPFAQSILKHIRQLVHEASPLVTETIKWGAPFFEYKGMVCHMNAFKAHCGLGFWNSIALNDPKGFLKRGDEKDTVGNFGRITSLDDLPPDAVLKDFVQQAVALNENGRAAPIVKKSKAPAPIEKAPLAVPVDFADLLEQTPNAKEVFEKFSPSHKKEYLQWIVEAKTDATRIKRMQQAVEMIGEGKSRHWKYAPQPPKGGA